MDVGVINETLTSFDIDALGETNAVLIRNDGLTRFLYKDEDDQLVTLEKSEVLNDVLELGTLLKISDVDGYAHAVLSTTITSDVCGKLACAIDWNDVSAFHSRQVVDDNGVTRTAYLLPVVLY